MPTQWPTKSFVDRAYDPTRLPPGMYQRNRVPATGMDALQRTIGSEVDQLWTAAQEIEREMVPSTAQSWGLDWWDATLLLPADASLSVPARQQRIVDQLQQRWTVLPYPEWLRRLMGDSVTPTVLVQPGIWLVAKRAQAGWPGDATFLAWERKDQAHTGALGAYIAPWDTTNGLTVAQVDLMHTIAVDQLTIAEVDGPPLGEEWLHLDAESLAWSAVDALGLDWATWDRRHA